VSHQSCELPSQLYRAVDVRALDQIAIKHFKIPGSSLMERAGTAAFNALKSNWPDAKHITIVCGPGNNGGDGYVIARLAHEAGFEVQVLHAGSVNQLRGDAKTAADKFIKTGIKPEKFSAGKLSQSDVIVDALLGTGLDREVTGEMKTMIDDINHAGIPVFSIDIPSGLHADTGSIMGCTVKAEATMTFIGLKQGLFTGQGAACSGKIFFSDLNVPPEIYGQVTSSASRIDLENQSPLLPKRSRSAHKGNFGHVLIVGGDHGYTGAPLMASEAAARVGAGLVSLATRSQHAIHISTARPEIMAQGVEQAAQLSELLKRATVIGIGPGLGQSEWALMLLGRVLDTKLPLVVDADALNLLAQDPIHRDNWILTPHPGEAARLLDCTSMDIQHDRFAAVKELQQRYGGVIVLKGSGTLVIDASGRVAVCSDGNPGMATGGMGDVLTGVIAGLVAQGMALPDAARLGVCVHAAAADEAAKAGERGMLATDLMPCLRKLVNFSRR
jgi:ADP-dependent NAD(P)H-hydrate dehydratase / NAD(P)H-hydrate epimerase